MNTERTAIGVLVALVRSGKTLEEACRELLHFMNPDDVLRAKEEYRRLAHGVTILKDPPSIQNPEAESWYLGPREGDRFWWPLRRYLQSGHWDSDAIDALDRDSTKVVSKLDFPFKAQYSTKGLVVGYVQSGKTANFTAVIAKAADAGFRFFVVLSGLTDKLRRQTQTRLDVELVSLNPNDWICLTDECRDFSATHNVNPFLADNSGQKTLCVIKKNPARLRRLLRWLRGAQPQNLRNCPVLIVDDEADQASINTAQGENLPSVIFSLLTEIINVLPRVAYVGYTATPFANVFIDATNEAGLYPRDFIISLPRPLGYFGPERLFGRERLSEDEPEADLDGLDVIRAVDVAEIEFLRPVGARALAAFNPKIVPSLRSALLYFILAVAARRNRGQQAHSTMLIHTSQRTEVHRRFKALLVDEIKQLGQNYGRRDASLLADLEAVWVEERGRGEIGGETGSRGEEFPELLPQIAAVLNDVEIVMENHLAAADERIDFSAGAKTYIVVGGDILSRGLTLEGLIVSYFVRSASAYDTLLQMGRWFGFRRGYEDLPRIWMTDEMQRYFFDLATVEEEFRLDSNRYDLENISPLDFAPRVRTHPKLSITSKLKMGAAATVEVTYSLKALQSRIFKHRDREWLGANISAAATLVKRIRDDGVEWCPLGRTASASGRYLAKGVDALDVLDFLSAYRFHENSVDLRSDLICQYIRLEMEGPGLLTHWNVAWLGKAMAAQAVRDLGSIEVPFDYGLISRSQLQCSRPEAADIKALISRPDIYCDTELTNVGANAGEKLCGMRSDVANGCGLLLLYPIDKRSAPGSCSGSVNHARKSLDAVVDVLGVGLVFPRSGRSRGIRYVSADLSGIEREEFVLPDEEEGAP